MSRRPPNSPVQASSSRTEADSSGRDRLDTFERTLSQWLRAHPGSEAEDAVVQMRSAAISGSTVIDFSALGLDVAPPSLLAIPTLETVHLTLNQYAAWGRDLALPPRCQVFVDGRNVDEMGDWCAPPAAQKAAFPKRSHRLVRNAISGAKEEGAALEANRSLVMRIEAWFKQFKRPSVELEPRERLNILLEAGHGLNDNQFVQSKQLGKLSRQDFFLLAAEIALQYERDRLPEAAALLLQSVSPLTNTFPLFGVPYHRAELEAWAQGKNLPENLTFVAEGVLHDVDKNLALLGSENVHRQVVSHRGAQQLNVMRSRSGGESLSFEQARSIVERYPLKEDQTRASLTAGLDYIVRNEHKGPPSPVTALPIVIAYIEHVKDPELQNHLRAATVERVIEIAQETPCQTGRFERVVDIPSGIDFSLYGVTPNLLRTEVAELAAQMNEEFEHDYGQSADEVRTAYERDNSRFETDPDEVISEIKRDMLAQRAHAKLVIERGLPAAIVRQAIDLVFPQGVLL